MQFSFTWFFRAQKSEHEQWTKELNLYNLHSELRQWFQSRDIQLNHSHKSTQMSNVVNQGAKTISGRQPHKKFRLGTHLHHRKKHTTWVPVPLTQVPVWECPRTEAIMPGRRRDRSKVKNLRESLTFVFQNHVHEFFWPAIFCYYR